MNENLIQNNNPQIKFKEPKYINQNDFIYFKNELLKDLKEIESKILDKVKTSLEQNDEKMLSMDSKINTCRTKIFELTSSINSNQSQSERLNKLIIFKSKTEEKISSFDERIRNLKEYLNESIYSMNKSIKENINYPGIVGSNSKFANLRAFIDFVMNNINNINSFKEKMAALDIQNYKTKLDKIMKSYKMQIDTFMNSTKNSQTENLLIYDNKVAEILKLFENRIEDEKNELKKNIEEISKKYNDINIEIENIKNDLIDKIGINNNKYDKKFMEINLLNEKYISDMDKIFKKIEENNENIKKINSDFGEKMKDQENKLLSKINHLFSLIKKNNDNKNYKKINPYRNKLDKDIILDKELNNFRSLDPNIPTWELGPVESRLKKYIEGEIGVGEIITNREKKNTSNETEKNNKINKILDNDEIPCINNIKFIKFHNEAIKNNNKENIDNKLFMDRKKVDSYIIEKENIIINRIPRKQIIKNLLQGSSEPISIYLKQNKEERKNIINKIRTHQKITLTANRKLDNSFKNRFHNSNSQFFQKKKSEDGNSIDNNELLEDLNEINNKRTFSSGSKTRNNEQNSMRQNSIMGYNTTEILKDNNNNSKNKDNNDDEDNNLKIINNDIFNNKEDDYNKKKNKIINNFNSASKLFDLNVKNENLIKSKYKLLNPLHKNLKIIKSPTNQYSHINHELKLKNDKDKEKIKRHSIHYYFSAKNKNT